MLGQNVINGYNPYRLAKNANQNITANTTPVYNASINNNGYCYNPTPYTNYGYQPIFNYPMNYKEQIINNIDNLSVNELNEVINNINC